MSIEKMSLMSVEGPAELIDSALMASLRKPEVSDIIGRRGAAKSRRAESVSRDIYKGSRYGGKS